MARGEIGDEEDTLEGLDLVKRGQALVKAREALIREAGKWIDTEYSKAAVVSRRKLVQDAIDSRPRSTPPSLPPSAFKVPGSKSSKDTRLWRLSAVQIDVFEAMESRFDSWMSIRDPDREFHAAIGLIVGLLSHDAKAGDYLKGITKLASLKWLNNASFTTSRIFAEPNPIREDRLKLLRTAVVCLEQNMPDDEPQEMPPAVLLDNQRQELKTFQIMRPPMLKSVKLAGESLTWLESERPGLFPSGPIKKADRKAQFEYLKEHGCPTYDGDPDKPSKLPAFETWYRYIRAYLQDSEGSRISATSTRSIVKIKDL